MTQTDPRRFVFLDESGAKTNMTRWRGRALSHERLHAHRPEGHWCTTSMLAAVSLEGPFAPMAIEGAVNTQVFQTWVDRLLVPTLKPGQIVVMDNLAAHKQTKVIEAIETVGAEVWFLPPYSPDLNPIEQLWSKVKRALRQFAPRDFEALVVAIGRAFQQLTLGDCRGFFHGCGYLNEIR
jgi:transposase